MENTKKIITTIKNAGGEAYLVGGAVRDELLNMSKSRDIDFLIRNLELSTIFSAVKALGATAIEMDEDFGTVKATFDGEDFDFAIPRTVEEKTGEKHVEFKIKTDPGAPVEEDLVRRDFTVNALAKDSDGKIIDFFGGLKDLQDKLIRTVGNPDQRFQEDPLRMLRAIQFATRFNFGLETETALAIEKNLEKLDSVSGERILLELEKAWTKGTANSAHLIEILSSTGMGKSLFGSSFLPQPVQAVSDPVIGNFVAFFIHGGNFNRVRPTKEMVTILNVTRAAIQDDLPVYKYAGNQRIRLPLVMEILDQLGYSHQASKIRAALELPLNPKELGITGKDLVKMGYNGQAIGKTMQTLLEAVHNGEIRNEYNEMKGYIQ